jgi:hypothetical protein
MKLYAGIGARSTPKHVLAKMYYLAGLLAIKGYTCSTGAAKGADQEFANGAFAGLGEISLHLPWATYESDWITTLGYYVKTSHMISEEAFASVYKYHPHPDNLKQAVVKLHARNYQIVQGVEFVICWTPNGETAGGTGQAIRICKDLNIPVYNLGNPETFDTIDNLIESKTKHKLNFWTAQYRYSGPNRLDITVKGKDPIGHIFAPSWDIVMGYKNNGDEQQYISNYHQQMLASYKNNRHLWDQVLAMEEVVLVCFCKSGDFCHRKLVAHYLQELGSTYKGEISTQKTFYYCHPESECTWTSLSGPEIELGDGLTENITVKEYNNLKKKGW